MTPTYTFAAAITLHSGETRSGDVRACDPLLALVSLYSALGIGPSEVADVLHVRVVEPGLPFIRVSRTTEPEPLLPLEVEARPATLPLALVPTAAVEPELFE